MQLMTNSYGSENMYYGNWEYKTKNSWESIYGGDGSKENLWRKKVFLKRTFQIERKESRGDKNTTDLHVRWGWRFILENSGEYI